MSPPTSRGCCWKLKLKMTICQLYWISMTGLTSCRCILGWCWTHSTQRRIQGLLIGRGIGYLLISRRIRLMFIRREATWLLVCRWIHWLLIVRGVIWMLFNWGLNWLLISWGGVTWLLAEHSNLRLKYWIYAAVRRLSRPLISGFPCVCQSLDLRGRRAFQQTLILRFSDLCARQAHKSGISCSALTTGPVWWNLTVMTARGSFCALERIGLLAPPGGRWPRKTAKIINFHVWAYCVGIYEPRALKFFVRILNVISNKSFRWRKGGSSSLFSR